MDQVEEYLTLQEAGDVLHVSKQTIRRWVDEGEIPAFKLGIAKSSPVRLRRSDIDAFVDRHRRGAALGYKRPSRPEAVA